MSKIKAELHEVWGEVIDWIQLAQDGSQLCNFVNGLK
jgi:hypothetical protein